VIVPGSSPPIALGNPPVVGPLPPSTIDARGVDLSFTTDESQPILGMPGSRLGTPLTTCRRCGMVLSLSLCLVDH